MENKYGFQRHLFDKGKFYFDGVFNVVEFDNVSLYHGSPYLSLANVQFPMKDFYTPSNNLTSTDKEYLRSNSVNHENKMKLLYKKLKVSHIWVGDLEIAHKYSHNSNSNTFYCEDFCIHAYSHNKVLKFIDMSDPFNLMVIVKYMKKYLSPSEIKDIRQDFKISPQNLREKSWAHRSIFYNQTNKSVRGYHPFHKIKTPMGTQSMRSSGEYSKTPSALIKLALKFNYDGYTLPKINQIINGNKKGERLGEFVVANPHKTLTRDYTNSYDWQYQGFFRNKNIKIMYDIMSKYKTYNVDFHAGNLIEHSIWTALYLEEWFKTKHTWCNGIRRKYAKIAIFSAFLHDIGKVQEKHFYYNVNSHPHDGKTLLLDTQKVFVNDTDPDLGILDFNKLFKSLNFTKEDLKLTGFISELHWEFGNCIKSGKDSTHYLSICTKMYKKLKFKTIPLKQCVNILIAVSAADIKAMQQYTNIETLKQRKNHKSSYFSWLKNRSKVWPGKNAYKDFNIEEKGLPLRSKILEKLYD